MTDRILVTYASRTGSTAEVAEAIGKTLAEDGSQVDILPMEQVKDLAPYGAVVAGSAIRGSRWLPEALQFILTHRRALERRRFAMFTVCITMAMKNAHAYRSAVLDWVAPVRSMVQPLSEEVFAGRLDFDRMPLNKDTLLFRLSTAFGLFPRGDHRDWNAIRSWAERLRPVLRGTSQRPFAL
jgi:menaquinone-dependent protoporphyrinogen oxidase